MWTAMKQIVHEGMCDDEILFQHLVSAGLITGETRTEARLRCELYQEYFSRRL
jgi:hypothetical protein